MTHEFNQPKQPVKARVAAVFISLACAGTAWAISAGSVLAPGPADLTTPLGSDQGSLAVAVETKTKSTSYALWPEAWTTGSIAAGTPCSTYGLAAGAVPTKRIEASGRQRRCVDYNPNIEPPANAKRPLPPMPIDREDKAKSTKSFIAKTVNIVSVINWPAEWTEYNTDSGQPAPYPGEPCSDFELFAGETTYKHIQTSKKETAVHRCVPMTEPIYGKGP